MKEYTKKVILLIVLSLFTLLVLFITLRLNYKRQEDMLSKSSISKYLTEIKYDNISSYLVEQPSIIIYVSNSSLGSSNEFEKKFIPVIIKYNLENEFVYININVILIVLIQMKIQILLKINFVIQPSIM